MTTITSFAELQYLQNNFPRQKISIEMAGLPEEEQKEMEGRLNRHISECGCDSGSYFLAGGLVLYGIFLLAFTTSLVEKILFAFLFAFPAAILGKVLGKLKARVKFKFEIRKILQQYAGASLTLQSE